MPTPLDSLTAEYQKIKEHLELSLASIRTGRAMPSLIEQVPVAAYGAAMRLMEVASISAPDPKTLVVEPWDKQLLRDVEKALLEAHTGCSVAVDKTIVRLTVPALTLETREKMKKNVLKEVEQAKVALRVLRDSVKQQINGQEKVKTISEDEKFRLLEKLDKEIKQFQEGLNALGKKKEKELEF
ncbi:MAG: ribosome-recycling factor [Patescibacteria group bacterium]